MASRSMNCVEKRDLLHSSKPAGELIKAGENLLDDGLCCDALQFFLRAEHEDGVSRIRKLAIEEGDTFLIEQLVLAGREIDPSEWRSVADNARRLEKFHFAIRALRAAGDDAAADKLAAESGDGSGADGSGADGSGADGAAASDDDSTASSSAEGAGTT